MHIVVRLYCVATGNLSIRLTAPERRALDADASRHDVGPSTRAKQVIREHLGMGGLTTVGIEAPDYGDQIDLLDRRLARLEEMAGI